MDCTHTDMIKEVSAASQVCEDCVALGDPWVQLRYCRTCGHTGCCDDSKNTHAARHARAVGHPIVRSLEPGENWSWCYIDRIYLDGQ